MVVNAQGRAGVPIGPDNFLVTFDREQVVLNTILQTALASGAEIVSVAEDVKHLNQAFMDLTEPGVRS